MSKLKDKLLDEALDNPDYTLLNIAMVRAWNYAHDYDPVSGREVEKAGFLYLKDGYASGFLDGVAYKFGGE